MLPHRVHQSDDASSCGSIETIVNKMANSAIDDPMSSEAGSSFAASNQAQRKVMKSSIGDIDEKMDVSSDESEPFKSSTVAASRSNLEYLPADILMAVFKRTDGIGLMHLAEMSHRFADIGQIFVINSEEMGGDSDIYLAKWPQIGNQKQVIYINHFDGIGPDHWALKMLQPHIDHIKRLTFDSCKFQVNGPPEATWTKIFEDPMSLANVTHLTIRHSFCDCNKEESDCLASIIDLSGCQSLMKLEIHGAGGQQFWWKRLMQIIQNNPMMQSLLLYDLKVPYASLWEIIPKIATHLVHINELALVMDSTWSEDTEQMNDLDFNSFGHLTSLSLSVDPKTIELFQHFGIQCKQIKHFGLHVHGASTYTRAEWKNVLIRVAHSFQQIESFHYYLYESIKYDIEPFVEQLPDLRELRIEPSYQNDIECSEALPLLQVCPSLQKITIVFKYSCDGYPKTFVSAKFFEEFIKTTTHTAKPNASIEIEERNRIIGSITTEGIIWRNKLMYWMDCDKNYGSKGVQLLDLVDHPSEGEHTPSETDQLNLLDRICDYLDISSLHSFAETNEESKQLVVGYVKKHSERRGTFTITDEIQPFELADLYNIFGELELIEHATALKVHTIRRETKNEIIDAIQSLQLLEKLSIYDEHPLERWPCVTFNISHVVYDASHCMEFEELHDVVEKFPDAKTIELKKAGLFNDNKPDLYRSLYEDRWSDFYDSKKLVFNYRSEAQIKNLKRIFKDVNIQLVPVFPKKN